MHDISQPKHNITRPRFWTDILTDADVNVALVKWKSIVMVAHLSNSIETKARRLLLRGATAFAAASLVATAGQAISTKAIPATTAGNRAMFGATPGITDISSALAVKLDETNPIAALRGAGAGTGSVRDYAVLA